jgi:hypothetical protein
MTVAQWAALAVAAAGAVLALRPPRATPPRRARA